MRIFLATFFLSIALLGSNLEFNLYKQDSNISGDTLLVVGGIHGNEPGGYFAGGILAQSYKITKGSLWVIPNLNFESLLRGRRGIYGDMNRKFHYVSPDDKDYEDIQRLKKIMTEKQVDLILNLHDGRGYYRDQWENAIFNPAAWGQSFIIDQEKLNLNDTPYANLDAIAKEVSLELNKVLIENHHTFNIKNTKTEEKDEQMQLSLTYFAIKNKKPSFAVETSKNITDLVLKVKYQLKAIESFMKIMGIEFTRGFDLDSLEELQKEVYNYKKVRINNAMEFDLANLKNIFYYVPLKKDENTFEFEHPLGGIIRKDNRVDLMIGNQRVGSLSPQYFTYNQEINSSVEIEYDTKRETVPFASTIEVEESFFVEKSDYRVNIIGFYKEGLESEDGVEISQKDILPRFSIDKEDTTFRIEFYKDGKFSGMILVKFV